MVADISGLEIADKNRLVVELFKVYVSVTKSTETLDDFYYWGEMMLADFDDIDKYMIDARQLFSNVESYKEIDAGFDYLTEEQLVFLSTFWKNVLDARSSQSKEMFLGIWEKLFGIYSAFKKHLENKQLAYEGMMYRKMVLDIKNKPGISKWHDCVFVGFNALNKCEKALFKHMQVNCNGLFFWDYDKYYLETPVHEAALFMHGNLLTYPMPADFNFLPDNFSGLSKIEMVAVPGFSGQASYASNWFKEHEKQITKRFDNTAVVMCDETLLLSMVNSVPASVSTFNITMGFPVKKSPAFALVKGLVEIDRNSRAGENGDLVFYYRNVLGLLSNPLLKEMLGAKFDELSNKIRDENRIYLGTADFEGDPLLSLIFNLPQSPEYSREYLQNIIKTVFRDTAEDDKLLKESLYQLHLAINRLHDSIFDNTAATDSGMSKKLYYQLLLKQLDRLSIPFEGEPLSGLQLMGFLETRCLDFDNIVLLSFNDDKLPGNPHRHSFIPYTLRKGFGLPVSEQRNAMYAYYFYRLIQRAKNVSLVYDSRTEGLSNGEISRFGTQLKYEASHIEINERQAVFNFEPELQDAIEVEKTPLVQKRVEAHMQEKRISPSALNVYIDCKLKFYFQYIENIKEANDVQEDIDHLIFGRVAHQALEYLYKPFEGHEITKEIMERIISDKKKFDAALRKAMEKEYFKKGNFNLNGRNMLVFEIIKKYILRILKYDLSITPFTLMGLEKEYNRYAQLETGGKSYRVKYGGYIDRIDRVGDKIRVVDYKTGKSDPKVLSIEKLFCDNSARNKAAFQTMLYASCAFGALKPDLPVLPSVYGARAVFSPDFSPFFTINGGQMNYQANAEAFDAGLMQLFAEILDPDVPFSQTPDKNTCGYCPFNAICNR
jgi:CRISPR/Cas system-associated exonuclease Cas4 (RecB family)